jgi:hypothetical protein
MVWESAVGEEPELKEMVVVLIRGLAVSVQDPEAVRPVGTATVGSVHSDVLISVTDRVAVLVVPSWRVLAAMTADKVGVVVGWLF